MSGYYDGLLVRGSLEMTEPALTLVEQTVLDCLAILLKRGYSPTVRDIQRALAYESPATVHDVLRRLRNKNRVVWEPKSPRTLRIVEDQ